MYIDTNCAHVHTYIHAHARANTHIHTHIHAPKVEAAGECVPKHPHLRTPFLQTRNNYFHNFPLHRLLHLPQLYPPPSSHPYFPSTLSHLHLQLQMQHGHSLLHNLSHLQHERLIQQSSTRIGYSRGFAECCRVFQCVAVDRSQANLTNRQCAHCLQRCRFAPAVGLPGCLRQILWSKF